MVQLIETALLGGLTQTGLAVVFGLLFVVASLVAFSLRAAAWWFAAFVASLVYAVLVPNWVDLVYEVAGPGPDRATNLVALSIVVFAVIAYFVRERDRLQKESDDLLHNILPEEITARLKREPGLIADSFNAASVLFADVVGFTPMSAGMSPTELVGLLNSVFSTFDRFVDQLALEKIKTVGDEYRWPQASRLLGLIMPRQLQSWRSGSAITSRPTGSVTTGSTCGSGSIRDRLVAGIIGMDKFAYDLWGDVVNTASRMESEGIAGAVQVTAATYDLIHDRFQCEPRGVIDVKGKGEMETYVLLARRR